MVRPRVYITGIAGLLGANLAFLLRDDFDIGGVDIYPVVFRGVQSDVYDLLSTSSLERRLIELRPKVVIHCAALVDVDHCERHPDEALRLNTGLTDTLSELCARLGSKLIFISTDAVFDGQKEGPYTEDDSPSPLNVYGRSKLLAEHTALRHEGNVVLRTNIYGWNYRAKQSFGEWIYNSLAKGDALRMFADVVFSPILVNELATAVVGVVTRNLRGLFHAGGTGQISKYEFGVRLKRVFDLKSGEIVKASVDDFGFAAKRAKNMSLDSSRLARELGFRSSTPAESITKFRYLLDSGYVSRLRGEQ